MTPEQLSLGGHPIVGFGQEQFVTPVVIGTGTSPWAVALTTSVVGAATGWAIEEIAKRVRGRQQR